LQDWPPYSPCPNPIENFWANAKRAVLKRMLTSGAVMTNSLETVGLFSELVEEKFRKIDPQVIRNACQSFVTRLEACVAAGGHEIPY
jgi:transposase